MSLFITSLNSGSNGNCYYIGNQDDAILVDAGISCRETERRMHCLGLSMQKVRAVFISHEHSDHIKGLRVLSKKYNLPIYITPGTLREGKLELNDAFVQTFPVHEPVGIDSLSVTAFPKFHDASEPHSFVISCNNICVGVFTDIGIVCDQVVQYFKKCHAAFLETNYDEEMLDKGRYPYFLKNRIRGGKGHLSNKQALDLFLQHRPPFMSHLLLSHLSQDNNCPDLVKSLFQSHTTDTDIIIASRHTQTALYAVG